MAANRFAIHLKYPINVRYTYSLGINGEIRFEDDLHYYHNYKSKMSYYDNR